MNTLIDVVGGESRASEIVKYHDEYFRNYNYYDVRRKMFAKRIEDSRDLEFIPVDKIQLELRKK